jgi:hypothetical protein
VNEFVFEMLSSSENGCGRTGTVSYLRILSEPLFLPDEEGVWYPDECMLCAIGMIPDRVCVCANGELKKDECRAACLPGKMEARTSRMKH